MLNEKRLIDVSKIINHIQRHIDENVEQKNPVSCFVLGFIIKCLEQEPTVDAVEVDDMREFAEDVACQFGYYCQNGGRLHITHGGLSTLEWAFDILGWENPHPVPEYECEIDGCHEHATCGTPTADGYKRVCGRHFCSIRTKMDGDGNG
jgi:hypothetical protein